MSRGNTGDCNTGNYNTGYCNTGNYNTGNWNTGDYNTGYCNTVTPEDFLIFNKPAKRQEWHDCEKPEWMRVYLTSWVNEKSMSDKEKDAYPSYVTCGGYLKSFSSLKEAYKCAWDRASEEDKALTFKLPNFDAKVFQEIFGFNPCEEKKVTVELTQEQLDKIKHLI